MEKRKHQRTKVDVEGIFMHTQGNTVFSEFSGTIDDISEGGVKLVINNPSEVSDSINIGSTIHFTGTDEYVLGGENRISLVEGNATVVRKEVSEEKIVLGCMLDSLPNALEDYIRDKKTSSFLVSIN